MSVENITEISQYLTFKLEEEIFALDVGTTREVLDYMKITKVPQSPEFMRGVINLRGSVVPVVDMRLKFGMSATEKTIDTCIIVVEIEIDGEKTLLGALADSVKEVMELEPNMIDPAPKISSKWNTDYIRGIGKHEEEFIIILDIDKAFSVDELVMLQGKNEVIQEKKLEEVAA